MWIVLNAKRFVDGFSGGFLFVILSLFDPSLLQPPYPDKGLQTTMAFILALNSFIRASTSQHHM